MKLFLGKTFGIALLGLVFVNILSAYASFWPIAGYIGFFGILAITAALSVKKLEYGILIALAELFTTSYGRLFELRIADFEFGISLRMGLFAMIMLVWLIQAIRSKKLSFRSSSYWWPVMVMVIVIVWGTAWGAARGNGLMDVFNDGNAYLYFLYVLPLYDAIKDRASVRRAVQVLAASAVFMAAQSLLVLYFFSHKFEVAMFYGYRWLRDFRIAEITLVGGDLYRVFLQSHIYSLIFFWIAFVFLLLLAGNRVKQKGKRLDPKHRVTCVEAGVLFLAGLTASTLVISLSRSFWVGLASSLIVFLILFLIPRFKKSFRVRWQHALKSLVVLIAAFSLGLGLIGATLKFPLPLGSQAGPTGSFFASRLVDSDEAALRSRWKLLPPLARATLRHPVIGSGFGTLVTFETLDPRRVHAGTELVTTFAFEWGYLDILLKLGLVGLVVYLILLTKLWAEGWRLSMDKKLQIEDRALALALIIGLVAVAATHAFSPYLNHPLGIGYLALLIAAFHGMKNFSTSRG